MSEEENPEVEEQRAEAEEVEASQPEEKNDALYKTLFDIAEEAVEEQEEYRPPVELNEAVATLDSQPEEEVVQEDVQEEAREEEPKKTEPKKKKLRKVIDPDVPEDVAKQPAFTASNEDRYEPTSEDVEFMEELIPDERAVYEKVLYADKRLGGDYKGKSKQC